MIMVPANSTRDYFDNVRLRKWGVVQVASPWNKTKILADLEHICTF